MGASLTSRARALSHSNVAGRTPGVARALVMGSRALSEQPSWAAALRGRQRCRRARIRVSTSPATPAAATPWCSSGSISPASSSTLRGAVMPPSPACQVEQVAFSRFEAFDEPGGLETPSPPVTDNTDPVHAKNAVGHPRMKLALRSIASSPRHGSPGTKPVRCRRSASTTGLSSSGTGRPDSVQL